MKPKPLWEAERDHVKAVLEFFSGKCNTDGWDTGLLLLAIALRLF